MLLDRSLVQSRAAPIAVIFTPRVCLRRPEHPTARLAQPTTRKQRCGAAPVVIRSPRTDWPDTNRDTRIPHTSHAPTSPPSFFSFSYLLLQLHLVHLVLRRAHRNLTRRRLMMQHAHVATSELRTMSRIATTEIGCSLMAGST